MRLDYQQVVTSNSMEIEELQRRVKNAASYNEEYSQKTEAFYKLEIEYKKL